MALAVAQHPGHVVRRVVEVVDGALEGTAVEVVVDGIGAGMLLTDERQHRSLDGRTGDVAVGVGGVPDHDGAGLRHGAADGPAGLAGRLGDGLDGRVLGDGFDLARVGGGVQRLLHPVGDRRTLLVLEDGERLGLDLQFVAAHANLAHETDDVAHLDFGVGTDAGLDERGTVDHARLVAEFEDGRAGGLSHADYLALNADVLADPFAQVVDGDPRDILVGGRFGLGVDLRLRLRLRLVVGLGRCLGFGFVVGVVRVGPLGRGLGAPVGFGFDGRFRLRLGFARRLTRVSRLLRRLGQLVGPVGVLDEEPAEVPLGLAD